MLSSWGLVLSASQSDALHAPLSYEHTEKHKGGKWHIIQTLSED